MAATSVLSSPRGKKTYSKKDPSSVDGVDLFRPCPLSALSGWPREGDREAMTAATYSTARQVKVCVWKRIVHICYTWAHACMQKSLCLTDIVTMVEQVFDYDRRFSSELRSQVQELMCTILLPCVFREMCQPGKCTIRLKTDFSCIKFSHSFLYERRPVTWDKRTWIDWHQIFPWNQLKLTRWN